MNYTRALLAGAAALAVTGTALATPNTLHKTHNAMSGKVQNFNMGPQNGSKQNGTGSIKAVGGGVWVKVAVFNEPKGASEPAHIHVGPCSKLNPKPWKVLSNVKNGTSITVVKGITIDQLKKGHYSVNVHDAKNLKNYVSCGDI